MQSKTTSLVRAGVIAALAGYGGAVSAAGFALIEQSASGVGNAFAGGSASAEDASTIFYNPAGMTHLPGRQVVLGVHGDRPQHEASPTKARLWHPPANATRSDGR